MVSAQHGADIEVRNACNYRVEENTNHNNVFECFSSNNVVVCREEKGGREWVRERRVV